MRYFVADVITFFYEIENSDSINKDYTILRNELFNHKPDLNDLPKLLLLSKIDSVEQTQISNQKLPNDIEILEISSLSGKNLEKAIQSIAYLIQT